MAVTVTQSDIAKACGLTRSAVAFALNPRFQNKVSADVRQRVLEVADELGYRPDRQAQLMRGMKSGLIGVIQAGGVAQFGAQRNYEVAKAIHDTKYQMLGLDPVVYREGVTAAVRVMLDARVEGVILITPSLWMPREEIRRLQTAGIPLVAMAGVPLEGVPQVLVNHREGMADLTRHLVGLGHRKIALIMSKEPPATHGVVGGFTWSLRQRIEGFRDAIRQAGGTLPDDEPEVSLPQTDGVVGTITSFDSSRNWQDPYEVGYLAMKQFLKDHSGSSLPDAVQFTNDDWAFGGLTACREAGIRVPEDLAITGFDDSVYSKYGAVPLTTVAQPLDRLAQQAVSALVELVEGRKTVEQIGERIVLLPCQLVVRESCGSKLKRA